MNPQECRRKTGAAVYVLGIAGTFLIMAFLVSLMRSYTQPPSLTEARAQERLKNLTDFRAANEPLLTQYDWQDQSKGIIRVPVKRAMELVLQEWQNPAAGRSNLLARAAKAFAPPPKVAPPKNPFE
jgi:hypothetical protein